MTEQPTRQWTFRVSLAGKETWVGPFSHMDVMEARKREFATFDRRVRLLVAPFIDQPAHGVLAAVEELGVSANAFQRHVQEHSNG